MSLEKERTKPGFFMRRTSPTHDHTQRWHSPPGSVGTGLASGYWPKGGREVRSPGPHTQHSLLVPVFLEVTQNHLTQVRVQGPLRHMGKGPFVRLGDHRLRFEGLGRGESLGRCQSSASSCRAQHPDLARSVVVQISAKHLF